MSKNVSSMEELLCLFKDYVDEDDIILAQISSYISGQIVKYRLEHKMSQKEFADFLDISLGKVLKIENSIYNFTIKDLVELCNKMDLNLSVHINA